jgi:hypothetical protein
LQNQGKSGIICAVRGRYQELGSEWEAPPRFCKLARRRKGFTRALLQHLSHWLRERPVRKRVGCHPSTGRARPADTRGKNGDELSSSSTTRWHLANLSLDPPKFTEVKMSDEDFPEVQARDQESLPVTLPDSSVALPRGVVPRGLAPISAPRVFSANPGRPSLASRRRRHLLGC